MVAIARKREADVLSKLLYDSSIPCEYMLICIAQRLIQQTWNYRAVLLVTGGFVYIQSFTMTSFALTSGTVRTVGMIRCIGSWFLTQTPWFLLGSINALTNWKCSQLL